MTKFTNCDDVRQVYEPRIGKWRHFSPESPYAPRITKISSVLKEIDKHESKWQAQRNSKQSLQELESAYEAIISLESEVEDELYDVGVVYIRDKWVYSTELFREV